MSPDRQAANVALVRDAFETFDRGGVDALLARYEELFPPDFELAPAVVGGPERGTYRGREGWVRWKQDLLDAFEWVRFVDLAYEVTGPEIVLVTGKLHSQGKHSGVALDDSAGGWVLRVRDGRIAAFHAFRTPEEAREEAQRAAA